MADWATGGRPGGCRRSLSELVGFALATAGAAAVVGGLVSLATDWPWWKVFRRCASMASAVMLWVFVRGIARKPWRALGLGSWSQGRRELWRGVLLGGMAGLGVGAVYLLTGICRIDVNPDTVKVVRTLTTFVPGALLVAVLEELVFRGYVLQQLLACSRVLAVVGSSAAYALVHLKPDPVWPGTALELVGLFILGCVLVFAALRTRQLYLPIGLHASLAYLARTNKLLIEFPDAPLAWLVGTSRLVNGVIPWLALVGLGWAVSRGGEGVSARR